jgi:hypothetical protein
MATSGTADFNLTVYDVIVEALELLTILAAGEEPSAEDVASAKRSLNMMLKAWEASGIYLWTQTEDSFATVIGQAAYLFGAAGVKTYRPLRIISARYDMGGGNELPMRLISRQEYFEYPLKSTQGVSTTYYYDPQRSNGTLYLWPVPANVTTLRYTYVRALEDAELNSNNLDMPQEWLETLAYNLAVRLAPKFGVAAIQSAALIKADAAAKLEEARGWDHDPAPTELRPDYEWMGMR